MTKTNLIPALLSVFTATALAQDIPFSGGDPHFLFVGNSYTGQNGLANVFERIIEDGIPEWKDLVSSQAIQQGGRTLGAHLMDADGTNGDRALRQTLVTNPEPWKWVTLQDQSQVPGFYQWDWAGTEYWRSTQAAIQLNDYIEDLGGQTMFFMTWGRRDGDRGNDGVFPDFLTMQEKLEEGYKRYQLATSSDTRPTYIAPAGLVFKTIYKDELNAGDDPLGPNSLFRSLYTGDGSHPSIRGTYVAALTIYTSMTGKSPVDINWFPSTLDEATGRLLQSAVSRTILETFKNETIEYPWKDPFTDGTSPPTTQAPTTQAPTTQAPVTQAPTTQAPTTGPPTTKPPTSLAPATQPPTTASPTTQSPTSLPPVTSTPTTQPPTTQPPTTAAPNTERPTSLSPVTSTPVVSGSSKRGSITITLRYDEYPEEISWTFRKKGATAPLFYQPFRSSIASNSNVSITFDNLEPQSTYVFQVSDLEGDGICCRNGEGSIQIYDNNQKRTMFFVQGEFQGDLGAEFRVLGVGYYVAPGTWKDLNVMIAPIAEGNSWPGAMPTQPTFSLIINVETDLRPQDLSWTLSRKNDDNLQYSLVSSWDGSTATAGTLESTEFANLELGWYHLVVKDKEQNGLCCDFGRGYITVTGPIAQDGGAMGLVWGNNGQFLAEEEIFFHISVYGFVTHVGWGSLVP